MINKAGAEAYIFPHFYNLEVNKYNLGKPILKALYSRLFDSFRRYSINKEFSCKVIKNKLLLGDFDGWVVVYPEIVFGNPLNAKNVVRWYLHNPGFHTKKIYFGSGELCFKYHNGFSNFVNPGSKMSENILNIVYYPLNFYNMDSINANRQGVAYVIRKGKGRELKHVDDNSILIDGMSHVEVARVFKSVKVFISYDLYTAYSYFAALCGCDSIVMPMPGVSKEQWYPQEESRYGLAYGFEEIEYARKTRSKLIAKIKSDHERNAEVVTNFIEETQEFFGEKDNYENSINSRRS